MSLAEQIAHLRQLATARTQQRVERRARSCICPICHDLDAA
jgi:hypothetical protein